MQKNMSRNVKDLMGFININLKSEYFAPKDFLLKSHKEAIKLLLAVDFYRSVKFIAQN